MATAYTSLLGFALPVTGELSGTWGDTVNDSITKLVEDSIAGTATASVASGDWTLTTTGSGQANQARCAILIPTGSSGSPRNIIAPSSSKAYIVDNQSNVTVTLKGAATTGTAIAAGVKAVVAWNGSDFITVSSSAADGVTTISFGSTGLTPSTGTSGAVTVAGTLGVSNGGTGATTLTGVVKGSGTSALTAGTVSLTSEVSGTLPVANGGTGITSFGTGVATALGTAINTTGGYVTQSGTLAANNILLGGGSGTAVSSSSLLSTSAAVTSGTYIKSIGYADTVVALGNTGTAINLDVVSGGVFSATLTGNATITLRYPVASGSSSFTLILTNDGTAGRTVAWAGGSFKFPGGAASLSRTTTANAVDIWAFFTPDGGTTWYGNIVMKDVKA